MSENSIRLTAEDERLIARYVDDQLTLEERASFDARCAGDASLRLALADAQQARELLAADREAEAFAPSTGFLDGVLSAARRLPTRSELDSRFELGDCSELSDGSGLASDGPVAAAAGDEPAESRLGADAARLAVTVRHALVAAVLVCGAALVLFGGVLRNNDTGRLQASPQELRLLDQRIERARAAGQGGADVRKPAVPAVPAERGR